MNQPTETGTTRFLPIIPSETEGSKDKDVGSQKRVFPPMPQTEETVNKIDKVLKKRKKRGPAGSYFGCGCGVEDGRCVRETMYEYDRSGRKTGRTVSGEGLEAFPENERAMELDRRAYGDD